MVTTPVLTDEERTHWDQFGFLHIKNCLSDDEISSLSASLDLLAEEAKSWPEDRRDALTSTAGNGDHLDIVTLPFVCDDVHPLMDHPNVFGRVLSLMGPFIQIPGMEYLERHPHDGELLRMHMDGGGSFRCMFPSPGNLVLQLKVQYFLTDTEAPDLGNFMMVPGSHQTRFPDDLSEIEALSRRARPLLARKGDALIFPWSLWHGVAPNRSTRTRKSVITRYSQLWMRPVEYDRAPEELCARLTPRRRRLLGGMPECRRQGDYYRPDLDQQVSEIFGEEWRDHPDIYRYEAIKRPIKQLFDQ